MLVGGVVTVGSSGMGTVSRRSRSRMAVLRRNLMRMLPRMLGMLPRMLGMLSRMRLRMLTRMWLLLLLSIRMMRMMMVMMGSCRRRCDGMGGMGWIGAAMLGVCSVVVSAVSVGGYGTGVTASVRSCGTMAVRCMWVRMRAVGVMRLL